MSRARLGIVLSVALIATLAAWRSGDTRPARRSAPGRRSTARSSSRLRWRSVGPDRGGRSIAVTRRRGPAEGRLLRRDRRRTLEDDRRRRALGAGHRRPDPQLVGRRRRGVRDQSRTSSSSAWASRASAATSCRATASTSPPTPARPGRTSASANSDAISKIRIHPTNPNIVFVADFGKYGVPQRRARRLQDAPTAARPGSKVLFRDDKTGGDRHRDRPQQPERDVRRAVGGVPQGVARCRAAARAAACSSPPTAARRGPRSRATPGLPAGIDGKIGVAVSRRRPEPRLRAGRERERRALPLGRRRRDVDARERRAATSASARSTTRTSSPIRRTRTSSTCRTSAPSARPTAARRSSSGSARRRLARPLDRSGRLATT